MYFGSKLFIINNKVTSLTVWLINCANFAMLNMLLKFAIHFLKKKVKYNIFITIPSQMLSCVFGGLYVSLDYKQQVIFKKNIIHFHKTHSYFYPVY